MRKIYFIIFGVALAVLILLVDWREKFNAITGRKPAAENPLDPLETSETAAGDSLFEAAWQDELGQTTEAPGPPPAGLEAQALLSGRFPAIPPGGKPSLPLRPPALAPARGLPADGVGNSPANHHSFQDLPEPEYLDESRQLLRQTVRHYDRILTPNANTPEPKRQND